MESAVEGSKVSTDTQAARNASETRMAHARQRDLQVCTPREEEGSAIFDARKVTGNGRIGWISQSQVLLANTCIKAEKQWCATRDCEREDR